MAGWGEGRGKGRLGGGARAGQVDGSRRREGSLEGKGTGEQGSRIRATGKKRRGVVISEICHAGEISSTKREHRKKN